MDKIFDEVIKRIEKNPALRNVVITKDNYQKFYHFDVEYNNCLKCNGLKECKNSSKGYSPVLKNNQILYKMCDCLKKEDRSNVTTLFLSSHSYNAHLEDFYLSSKERVKCLDWANNFINDFENNSKGLYLCGPYKTGKTFLLSAIANQLSSRGIKTILVFFPDLSRQLKSSLNTHNLEDLVTQLKEIDVLMLDDFGGEMSSAWLRDEIIAPVFQYRLTAGKPTFISSNLNYNELLDHLSTNKSGTDQLKAGRIIERIKSFSIFVELNTIIK